MIFPFVLIWADHRPPFGWKMYSNTSTRHHYSFFYPKEWVLTECGNGGVVVAKKPIKECLSPLEATDEYLNNVYIQVFVPSEKYSLISYSEANPSERLKEWLTRFYSYDEESAMFNHFSGLSLNKYVPYGGNAFPVKYDYK